MSESQLETRSQRFARLAYDLVSAVKREGSDYADYNRAAMRFPMLLRTAGACRALEFLESRNKNRELELVEKGNKKAGARRYLEHMAKAAHAERLIADPEPDKLCASAREAKLHQYFRLSMVLAEAAEWHHRFAQSLLDAKSTDADPNERAGE